MRRLILLALGFLLTACQQHLPSVAPLPAALQGGATTTAAPALPSAPTKSAPTGGGLAAPATAPAPAAKGTLAPVRSGVAEGPTPTPVPDRETFTSYTVKAGDTLSGIATKLDVPMSAIMKANNITDANRLQVGQTLKIPAEVDLVAPGERLLPDSEVVYGPPSSDFNVAKFAASQPGYLKDYADKIDGRDLTGAEIVQLVAQRYSVAPRLLLAMIELRGGWLSNPAPAEPAKTYPIRQDPARPRLYYQLNWVANQINEGYYGWKTRQLAFLTYKDGSRAKLNKTLNPGTLAVQFLLAQLTTPDQFNGLAGKDGDFLRVYTQLFGDAWARSADPVVPPDLKQPDLKLPWTGGERWYFTGGPHGAWGSGSAWAALDFIPGTANLGGCWDASAYWVTASAPGVVIRSDQGEVMVDLDSDGKETTGWNILYLHMASEDRVAVGTKLKTGDRIGHPSCEGGFSTGTHLHIVRKYNGEWVAAAGLLPFNLSGWTVTKGGDEYDGALAKGSETRDSCECRDDNTNGLLSDNR